MASKTKKGSKNNKPRSRRPKVKASPVEEKPKTARVKRLFRGLRKKS